jgi:hypothetical protein
MARERNVSADNKPPKNAAARVRAWAASGSTINGIARMLGVGQETFQAWRERYPKLQAAYDEGREMEHKVLFNALFEAAQKGNITAAIFLLKARHGYREGDQSELANRVSINFQLPGAMPLDKFTQARVIEHDDIEHSAKRLPAPSAGRPGRA